MKTAPLGVFVICWAISAHAQPAGGERAAQLFAEARAALRAGRAAEACAKLEESQRLEPAVGTALNLGACHEQLGAFATSHRWYVEAQVSAERAGQTKRADFARAELERIRLRAPRLVVRLASAPPGVVVRRDQTRIAPGLPELVDPGELAIEVSAPGHVTWRTRALAVAGKTVTVDAPPLRPLAPAQSEHDPPVAATPSAPAPPRRTHLIAWALGGTGMAVTGVGLGLGLSARSTWRAAAASCAPPPIGCSAADVAQSERARGRANLSTWLVGAGLITTASAVVWLIVDRRSGAESRLTLAPEIAPGTLGLSARGRF